MKNELDAAIVNKENWKQDLREFTEKGDRAKSDDEVELSPILSRNDNYGIFRKVKYLEGKYHRTIMKCIKEIEAIASDIDDIEQANLSVTHAFYSIDDTPIH